MNTITATQTSRCVILSAFAVLFNLCFIGKQFVMGLNRLTLIQASFMYITCGWNHELSFNFDQVGEAEKERWDSELEHQSTAAEFDQAERDLKRLQRSLRSAINKSRYYQQTLCEHYSPVVMI